MPHHRAIMTIKLVTSTQLHALAHIHIHLNSWDPLLECERVQPIDQRSILLFDALGIRVRFQPAQPPQHNAFLRVYSMHSRLLFVAWLAVATTNTTVHCLFVFSYPFCWLFLTKPCTPIIECIFVCTSLSKVYNKTKFRSSMQAHCFRVPIIVIVNSIRIVYSYVPEDLSLRTMFYLLFEQNVYICCLTGPVTNRTYKGFLPMRSLVCTVGI